SIGRAGRRPHLPAGCRPSLSRGSSCMSPAGFFEADGRRLSRGGIVLLMAPFFGLILFAFFYPLLSLISISVLEPQPTVENYQRVFDNPVYARVLFRTLRIAVLVSLLSLALSFPLALVMANSRGPKAIFLAACVLLPFWSSVLVRTAAWAVLLQRNGLINQGLQAIGLTTEPL